MHASSTPVPGREPGPVSEPATLHTAAPTAPVPLTGGTTVYFGRVFPVVWSTVVGALTGAVWLDLLPDEPAPSVVKWALLVVWMVVSTVIVRAFGGLRHVWRNGDELIVGDPQRGLRIHLRDVQEVRESRFQQVKTVTLVLRRPTPLGDRITFVPRGAGAFFFPLMSSSVAEALRERQEQVAAERRSLTGSGHAGTGTAVRRPEAHRG
jgi:hypothetical protein